jgi:hypothetical protein
MISQVFIIIRLFPDRQQTNAYPANLFGFELLYLQKLDDGPDRQRYFDQGIFSELVKEGQALGRRKP